MVSNGVLFGLVPVLLFTLAPIGIFWRKIVADMRGEGS
jgi:hypothetical protein